MGAGNKSLKQTLNENKAQGGTNVRGSITNFVREKVIMAAEVAGRRMSQQPGREKYAQDLADLVIYLAIQAEEHPKDYLNLLAKMVPSDMNVTSDVNVHSDLYDQIKQGGTYLRQERTDESAIPEILH